MEQHSNQSTMCLTKRSLRYQYAILIKMLVCSPNISPYFIWYKYTMEHKAFKRSSQPKGFESKFMMYSS